MPFQIWFGLFCYLFKTRLWGSLLKPICLPLRGLLLLVHLVNLLLPTCTPARASPVPYSPASKARGPQNPSLQSAPVPR